MRLRNALMIAFGCVQLLAGVSAMAGGAALVANPSGALLAMPLELLDETPFRSYLIPGLILCVVVGGSLVAAGLVALRRRPSAPQWGIVAGLILVIWIATQIALIGYLHPIQAAYLSVGAGIAAWSALLGFIGSGPAADSSRSARH
jgi:hypothetical protein